MIQEVMKDKVFDHPTDLGRAVCAEDFHDNEGETADSLLWRTVSGVGRWWPSFNTEIEDVRRDKVDLTNSDGIIISALPESEWVERVDALRDNEA